MKRHFFRVPIQGTDGYLYGAQVGLLNVSLANVLLENEPGDCHLEHADMGLELWIPYLNVLGEDYDWLLVMYKHHLQENF